MMLNNLARNLKNAAPTILTFLGLAGVVGTAVSCAIDTMEAKEKIEEAKYDRMTTEETIAHVAPCYIRTAMIGFGTCLCIAGANTLNKKQQASLISAYGVLNNRYLRFRKKTEEIAGKEKLQEIDAAIAEEEAKESDLEGKDGKILFYEPVTQTFFNATMYEVRDAEYKLMRMFNNGYSVTVGDFIQYLPFDARNITEKALVTASNYGWTFDYFIEWWGGEYMTIDFYHLRKKLKDGTPYCMIGYEFTPINIDYNDDLDFEEFEFGDSYYEKAEGTIMD